MHLEERPAQPYTLRLPHPLLPDPQNTSPPRMPNELYTNVDQFVLVLRGSSRPGTTAYTAMAQTPIRDVIASRLPDVDTHSPPRHSFTCCVSCCLEYACLGRGQDVRHARRQRHDRDLRSPDRRADRHLSRTWRAALCDHDTDRHGRGIGFRSRAIRAV